MKTYLKDFSWSLDEHLNNAGILRIEGTTPVEIEIVETDLKIPITTMEEGYYLTTKVRTVLKGNIYYTRKDMIKTTETEMTLTTKEEHCDFCGELLRRNRQ